MKIYIPIKENSQRVPNKNFRDFGGLPLWESTINKLTDFDVIVDTDSKEIIDKCWEKSWVTAYERPEELRGDKISVVDLVKNYFFRYPTDEWICQVHVTSPFLSVKHLKDLESQSKTWQHDSAFSVDVVQNRFWRSENYGFVPVNHNPMKLEQTQDLPKYYMENSYFYLFTTDVLKLGNRVGKNPALIPIGFPYNIDIDTESDWELVTGLLNSATT